MKDKIFNLNVSINFNGSRIDKFLRSELSSNSRTRLQNLIHDGLVKLNKNIVYEASKKIRTGDKIEIRIPEQAAEVVKGEIAYDPEHSGTYLIKQVNHQFNMTDSRNVYTVLDLVRDSQGIKDQESNVK